VVRSFVAYTSCPLVATVRGIFTPASTKVCLCVILPPDDLHDYFGARFASRKHGATA
jgi:hypothetical protein